MLNINRYNNVRIHIISEGLFFFFFQFFRFSMANMGPVKFKTATVICAFSDIIVQLIGYHWDIHWTPSRLKTAFLPDYMCPPLRANSLLSRKIRIKKPKHENNYWPFAVICSVVLFLNIHISISDSFINNMIKHTPTGLL